MSKARQRDHIALISQLRTLDRNTLDRKLPLKLSLPPLGSAFAHDIEVIDQGRFAPASNRCSVGLPIGNSYFVSPFMKGCPSFCQWSRFITTIVRFVKPISLSC